MSEQAPMDMPENRLHGARGSLSAKDVPTLAATDFGPFFEAVHGVKPFPWQSRLAEEVLATGRWPRQVRLWPGAGYSACIDVAVFHLALEADWGERRRAPLRIAHLLDRRCASNAAFDRACRLEEALARALDPREGAGVLGRIARRLVNLAGVGRPLIARKLAAGSPHEGDWAPLASQPTVICSTVDQVGSRLLFRGYGISDSLKPIHAGLFGADCLLLLDHVHFSAAFRETLERVQGFRAWAAHPGAPWVHVALDSMASLDRGPSFRLAERDYEDSLLSARFNARKPVQLVLAPRSSKSSQRYAEELVAHAWTVSGVDAGVRGRVVGIIANSIGLARMCQEVLTARIDRSRAAAKCLLLMGRSREQDRERLMRTDGRPLLSGLGSQDPTLFVATTQCVEAGTDVSFDALVSQIAPLDALRLRFAHLDRHGQHNVSEGVIVACQDEVSAVAADPLYGTAPRATWNWLVANADKSVQDAVAQASCLGWIDFGTATMAEKLTSAAMPVTDSDTPAFPAPTMMPAYLDLWSQTSPIPAADPEVGLFLHGVPDAADVLLIWRDDVGVSSRQEIARAARALELCPPRAREGIGVPLPTARAWLLGQAIVPTGDVEGPWSIDYFHLTPPPLGRAALRWCGDSSATQRVFAHEIRAGDVLIVPSRYGGADEAGWYPESHRLRFSVPRVGEFSEEVLAAGGSLSCAFRMHRELLGEALAAGQAAHAGYVPSVDALWSDVWRTLEALGADPEPASLARSLAQIRDLPRTWVRRLMRAADSRDLTVRLPCDEADAYASGIVFVDLESPASVRSQAAEIQRSTTETHTASFSAVPVTVEEFQRVFETRMQGIVMGVVFPDLVTSDLALAAWLSAEGKRDARYQGYLRGGDRMAAAGGGFVALATATARFDGREAEEIARAAVDLPAQWCPEGDSVRRALSHPRLGEARDRHLVLWLIGTLYGCGRPFYPYQDSLHSGPQDLDFLLDGRDWSEICAALQARYGWWGLAHLEAIVRLCEHRTWEHLLV